jgi:hypothetical protein
MTKDAVPVFRSRAQSGHLPEVAGDPRRVTARKRVHTIQVQFATVHSTLQTHEGTVHVSPGDAIMTGIGGEHWRVSHDRFPQRYKPVPPTVAGQSGAYQSLPIEVFAIRMDRPFEVELRDGISRLHGDPGEWLVDYGDGSLGIVATAIFDTTYEIVG